MNCAERPLEPRELALQHDEARARRACRRARNPSAAAPRRARRDPWARSRSCGGVPCWRTSLLPVSSVPSGTSSAGRLGSAASTASISLLSCAALGFERRLLLLALRRLAHDLAGVAALRLGGADLLGEPVALGLKLLRLGLRRAPVGDRAARIAAETGGRPRRARPRSNASGLSRIHLRSNMGAVYKGKARRASTGRGVAGAKACSRCRRRARPPPPPRAPRGSSRPGARDWIEIS